MRFSIFIFLFGLNIHAAEVARPGDPAPYEPAAPAIDPCAPPTSKQELVPALVEQLKSTEYLFAGEAHFANEQRPFIRALKDLKEAGLQYVALEAPVTEQGNLQRFLNTGDPNSFPRPWNIGFAEGSEWNSLAKQAHALGIKIVFIDHPRSRDERLSESDRNKFMADELLKLPREGKKLVITGIGHMEMASGSYKTARKIVNEARPTKGIRIESESGENINRRFGMPKDFIAGIYAASKFCRSLKPGFPERSFLAPAGRFPGLEYLSTAFSSPGRRTHKLYSESFDSILFLAPADTQGLCVICRPGQ